VTTAGMQLRAQLRERIDAIEAGYEFMLAYAARGIPAHLGTGPEIRDCLQRLCHALEGLPGLLQEVMEAEQVQPAEACRVFMEAVERDAATARAVLQLVLARPGIGSQLIDNVNALIHVRALLTDLFVADELVGGWQPE